MNLLCKLKSNPGEKYAFLMSFILAILLIGCSSTIPRITMLDVSVSISEQSRIWLKSNSDASIISVDGKFAWTKSSQGLIESDFSMDTKTDAFLYFQSGRRTITLNWQTRFTDWSNYNSYTNTGTEVTLSGNFLQFSDNFLPGHTYVFEVINYGGNYILTLVDVSKDYNTPGWKNPEIASNAPASGRATNWDYPEKAPYFDPSFGIGIDLGYSKIKRFWDGVPIINSFGDKHYFKENFDYGSFDISGQLFFNAGLGLGWENWGLGIISEIGGGFGIFYTVQWQYAFLSDLYFNKWNFNFGWGSFQGGQSSNGYREITGLPTPFLRGIITYKIKNGFRIGGFFDYYYKNDSFGFGFRWLGDMKGFPRLKRKALN